MSFKGPLLNRLLYGNRVLRQFLDLDILVPESHVVRAKAILMAGGYRVVSAVASCSDAAYMRHAHAFPLVHGEHGIRVDLHWRLDDQKFFFPLEAEWGWDDLQWVSVGGVNIPTLKSETLLLYLCLHGAKHLWSRLSWVCDIAALLNRRPGILTPAWLDHVASSGSDRILYVGLTLAHTIFGAPLSQTVVQHIQGDVAMQPLANRLSDQLTTGMPVQLSGIGAWRLRLNMRRRFRDQCRNVLGGLRCVNESDRAWMPLPFAFLQGWVRLLRLIWVYGRAAITKRNSARW